MVLAVVSVGRLPDRRETEEINRFMMWEGHVLITRTNEERQEQ